MAISSADRTVSAPQRIRTPRWRLLLILLTLITLGQVIFCDFSNWDDTYTVANDPGLNPPTWGALGHHWTHADMDIYMPATQSVWAGIAYFARIPSPDAAGVSLNPYAFHLANLLVHLAAVLIAFSLLRALGFIPVAAAIGAALFAVHPVQVEPVAWVSGLKDVLCGMCCLAALRIWLAPISRTDRPTVRCVAACAFATLAMLAKPSGMMLPILAVALLMMGRFNKRALMQLLPWAILSAGCAVVARLSQNAANVPHPSVYQRPFIAADTVWFYILKVFWPGSLCIDYGRTPQVILAQSGTWLWLKLASIVILFSMGWIFYARSKRRLSTEAPDVHPGLQRSHASVVPATIAGALFSVAAIIPVLGLVCFDFQEYSTVADHYLYLALFGPAVILAAILTRWPNRLLRCVAIVWILSLSIQSFAQCRVWKDAISLNQHAIGVNETSWVAHLNLAYALIAKSPESAINQAVRACELRRDKPRGWSCLAAAYSANRQPGAAREAARRAVTLRPYDPALLAAMGQYADEAGDWSQAIVVYQSALKYDPANINVMCNLAAILAEHDQKEAAAKWYQQALKQSPDLPAAKVGLRKIRSSAS